MSKRKTARRDEVGAKELAEMGFCEKRVLLAYLHGERTTAEQRRAMVRGQAAHQRYYEEGVASATDRRCFVATCVFGPDAAETQLLRAFRDAVLLPRWWGTCVVAVYYWIAPSVCTALERSPVIATGVRRLLRIVVAGCHKVICTGGRT